jgi:hypothetical protein
MKLFILLLKEHNCVRDQCGETEIEILISSG